MGGWLESGGKIFGLLSVNSLHFDMIILSVDWKIIKCGT